MANIVTAILETVMCGATSSCGYSKYCLKFDDVEELRSRVEDLNSRKKDVERVVECSRKQVRKEVVDWLRAVQRINNEMEAVEKKVKKVSCFSRAELDKLVRLKIEVVKEIFQQGAFPEGLIIDRPILPIERLEGEVTALEEIWTCLMSSEIGMIGVHGIAGIGKTTIMKQVHNQLLKSSLFHKVIWVSASDYQDEECAMQVSLPEKRLRDIQQQIACAMEVSLPENEGEMKSMSRFRDIMIEVKYVLILDGVREKLSLDRVGIPKPTKENGCKIVITAREEHVCNFLGCDAMVRVQPLTEQQSLNLFLDKVGLDILQVPLDLKRILKLMVKECAGFPLAIVVIAGSMRGTNDIHKWRNALDDLRQRVKKWSENPIFPELWYGYAILDIYESSNSDFYRRRQQRSENQIFPQLWFSYDRLEHSELQDCFLSCSLYPKGCEINSDELIEYWMDGVLIDEKWISRRETKAKAQTILYKLVNCCLLENARREGFVKMNDVMRDMVLHIKAVGPDQFMVMHEEGLMMWMPIKHEWTEVLKVSLIGNGILDRYLDMSPKCPKLSTLMLQDNIRLTHIPELFLTNMPTLSFLNLSRTGIEALPNSICNLLNLTSLILQECRQLEYVPSLASLRALKKLDLYEAGIEVVPEGIEMLENLKYLDLYCPNLVELPTGIISMLTRLQHFVLYWNSPTLKIGGEEVARLKNLETFKGQLYDLQDFNNYVKSNHSAGVSNYLLVVGPDKKSWEFIGEDCSRCVCLRGSEIGGKDFVELTGDLQGLSICQCHNVRSLNDGSISLQNTSELRSCSIQNCEGIECVIDMVSSLSSFVSNLENLALSELPNLRVLVKVEGTAESIWHTRKLHSSFSNLKTINISGCSRMKTLFPFEMLQDLQNLHDVTVENCKEMEEIIAYVEEEGLEIIESTTFTLPKLSRLELVSLPELTRICSKFGVLACDSLESIKIVRCPKLNRIPLVGNTQSYPPALRVINIESEWWESLLWDHPNSGDVLLPFVQYVDRAKQKASAEIVDRPKQKASVEIVDRPKQKASGEIVEIN